MLSQDRSGIAPEMLLAAAALAGLMWGAFGSTRRDPSGVILWATVAILVLTGLWVGFEPEGTRTAFAGSFVSDGFARFSKVLILFGSAATLALSHDYLRRNDLLKFEFPVLILLASVGMMTMVSASDLIVLYMGLELQSLALYVVAAFRRDSVRSTEAGLKYFVLGALSSGLLLYGASLTYGYAGTTAFSGIASVTAGEHLGLGLVFGLVFLAAGLAFKVSAVPFHMWTPDVYEGSPTPVTAFFATAPKVAAMAMIGRLMWGAFGGVPGEWTQVIAVMAVLSMFLGSIAGIGQRDIKRLMAYSSIAHVGFALIGLAAGTVFGVQSTLIYMAVYAVMNVGTFAFILSMERDGRPVTAIDDLNLLARAEPLKALAMTVLLFSLTGVPPMLGFFAKFGVLKAAVDVQMGWLSVLGVVASVIGAYYYLRIVYYMYFGTQRDTPVESRMGGAQWVALMGSAAAMIIGAFSLFGTEAAAERAALSLVGENAVVIPAPVAVATAPVD